MPNPLPTPTPPKNSNSPQGMMPPAPPKPMAPPTAPSPVTGNANATGSTATISAPPAPGAPAAGTPPAAPTPKLVLTPPSNPAPQLKPPSGNQGNNPGSNSVVAQPTSPAATSNSQGQNNPGQAPQKPQPAPNTSNSVPQSQQPPSAPKSPAPQMPPAPPKSAAPQMPQAPQANRPNPGPAQPAMPPSAAPAPVLRPPSSPTPPAPGAPKATPIPMPPAGQPRPAQAQQNPPPSQPAPKSLPLSPAASAAGAPPQMPPTSLAPATPVSGTPPAGLPPLPPKPGTPGMPPRPPMPSVGNVPLPPSGMATMTTGSGPRPPGVPPAPPAPVAPAAGTPPPPQMAGASSSPLKKFLPIILGGLALLGIIGLAMAFLPGLLGGGPTPLSGGNSNTGGTVKNQTTITYWGLWEPNAVMDQVFQDFEQANPGVNVEYVKQSHLDYRQRLQTAISQGSGPDLFRFHASWTPMLRDDLAVMPSSVYTPATFQSTFYPVAYQQLQYSGQLRGVPLMYDGLALYYNEDMLKAANAEVPKTWAELRVLADSLTVRANNSVERGGLAIGNSTNVEHFADILGLLMLQNGADPAKPTSPEAEQALIFYTDFIKEFNVWNDTLPNSTVAFARGDVAMMFAPSWRAHEILAQNPTLKFGIAPVPQLGERNVAWASYWAEGVNSKSKNKDASWKLISYLSSAEVMKKLYGQQSTVRRFGELYARRDLANELSSEAYAVPFLSDAPNARGWYLSSFTHDNGINDMSIKYYKDAITAVLKNGTPPKTALETVNQGINQVLRQFGVSTSTTQTAPSGSTTNGG